MTDERWLGLLLLGCGLVAWFLAPRVARQHHPDDPAAHTRRGPDVARVWSPEKRRAYVARGRVTAGLLMAGGVLILTGVL